MREMRKKGARHRCSWGTTAAEIGEILFDSAQGRLSLRLKNGYA
jgi:hypothetical protein